MGVAFHLGRPLEKAPETGALPPQKFPEFKKTDLRHLDAAVGLDAPEQIGAPPRSQVMALGCVPEKAEAIAHGSIITTSGAIRLCAGRVPLPALKRTCHPGLVISNNARDPGSCIRRGSRCCQQTPRSLALLGMTVHGEVHVRILSPPGTSFHVR